MVEVCKQFGWDYYTYLAQPIWFIDLILEKMSIDAKKSEFEQRKSEFKNKK